jgi:type IX secretion system PorP/SprF family membrane protein
MKTIYKITLIALLAGFGTESFAQQDALVSQYMFNQLFLSPAYAGVRNAPNFTGTFRKQWTSFDGAPVTQTLSYDQIIKKKMGIGLIVSNDKIGVSGQTDFYANYSYHLKLSSDLFLSLGLRGGASVYRADLTKLKVWDEDDASFSNNITGKWLPNFGTGVYLYSDKYYAGISLPHMLNYDPTTFLHANLDRAPMYERHFYLTTGYEYKASETITMKHSLLFKYVPAAPPQLDINAIAYYKSMIGVGISYRTRSGIVGLVEFAAKKSIKIGYSFDYSFSDLADYSSGSHEVMISYTIDKGESSAKFKE